MFSSRSISCAWWAAPALLCCPAFAQTTADVESAPRRIITIAPNAAEIICDLGACDRIVAVSKFCVYPPELSERPRAGGLFDPDLEKIVALRPDLIVLRGHNESIERLCEKRGIRVYRDNTQTLAEIEHTTMELGRMLGLESRAIEIVKQMRKKVRSIRKRVAGRDKPRVFMTYARRPDRFANLLAAGPGTFLAEMIEIAGGVNVFADLDMRYPQVSLEAIMAKRPDVVIELVPEVELTPALRRSMRAQWDSLGPIPAVKNDRVYFLTDDNALIPSPRVVEIIDKVSRLLHPEKTGGP